MVGPYRMVSVQILDRNVTDMRSFCISLQEVNTGPLRIVFDSVFDDPWSQCLMTSLAPWQYIKV